MNRLLLALLLILLIPTNANAVAGVEARCTELGSACACSEQLDSTDTYADDNPGVVHNWSESPDASSCALDAPNAATPITTMESLLLNTAFTNVAATGDLAVPGGGVTNVLKKDFNSSDSGDATWLEARRTVLNAGDERMCIRFYKIVDDDYSGSGSSAISNITCYSERNKIIQMAFGANELIQLESLTNDIGCWGPNVGYCDDGVPIGDGGDPEAALNNCYVNGDPPTCTTSGYAEPCVAAGYKPFAIGGTNDLDPQPSENSFSFGMEECNKSSGWCRIEVCVDDPNGLDVGTSVTVTARIKKLSTGVEEEVVGFSSFNMGNALGSAGIDAGGD